MQDDFIAFDVGVLIEQFQEVAEFAVGGAATTTAASHIDIANVIVMGIIAKAAISLAERLFAEKTATAFFDDVALQYDYVFDPGHFISLFSFLNPAWLANYPRLF